MDGHRGLPLFNCLLQNLLRSLCMDSQWVYAVFWKILPRNYPPPKWDTQAGIPDRSKGNKRNWILVWEDGYCDFSTCSKSSTQTETSVGVSSSDTDQRTDFQPKLFFKMSHEVYSYGEGFIGKVAADNSHKWVHKNPKDRDSSGVSTWHGALDPYPKTWEAQFNAGIQTVAVVAVKDGLLQLGSLHEVTEDLNFVINIKRKFNCIQNVPGLGYASHLSAPQYETRSRPTIHRIGAYKLTGENHLENERTSRPGDPISMMTGPLSGTLREALEEPTLMLPLQNAVHNLPIVGSKRNLDVMLCVEGNQFHRPFPSCSGNVHHQACASAVETSLSTQYEGADFRHCERPHELLRTEPFTTPGTTACLLPSSMSSLEALLSKLPSISTSNKSYERIMPNQNLNYVLPKYDQEALRLAEDKAGAMDGRLSLTDTEQDIKVQHCKRLSDCVGYPGKEFKILCGRNVQKTGDFMEIKAKPVTVEDRSYGSTPLFHGLRSSDKFLAFDPPFDLPAHEDFGSNDIYNLLLSEITS
ncbi:hypothetical protein O6H91_20G066800 [Diphasiastrum complanatum]|uniref:Uncharacterized protein n=1 Tax=Diphasiastrum complanatum TaxID=34168 RepID=A0ACC2ARJ5_DIPCM|nr:hypothetical protein O6H91_20G066800 [Diphasiastrum complanatum]